MWRFLFPALALTAALIVLFAGALGDFISWPDLSDGALAIISGAEPRHAREQQAARDALQRQVAHLQEQTSELQNQIEQRSHDIEQRLREIEALRTELDKLQQDALRQQRQTRRPPKPGPSPPPTPENCGTPDEQKPCPPMPRHPLPFYPADRE